jgi:hypothetical protein
LSYNLVVLVRLFSLPSNESQVSAQDEEEPWRFGSTLGLFLTKSRRSGMLLKEDHKTAVTVYSQMNYQLTFLHRFPSSILLKV